MNNLNPDKLFVEFRPDVTTTQPVLERKYTLTHSDNTADLYLTIGLQFAYEKVNTLRDEVLAEWRMDKDLLFLYVYVYVNGLLGNPSVRNSIFRRELPLALEAIRYGDRGLFAAHPQLGGAPIWIYFDSEHPEYNRFENWGTPDDYNLL